MRWLLPCAACLSVLTFALLPADADEPNDAAAARLTEMTQAAASYKIALRDDTSTPLRFIEQPILRYTDNITAVPDGAVFLWTDGGHPAAVLSVWYHPDGRRFHEFQSLSPRPLVAEADGGVQWQPEEPGVQYHPVPEAPPPAAEDKQRLVQMRTLARRFAAAVTDGKYGRQELRLLAQPLHRYGDRQTDVLDGAVFAFAKGTNPEIMLLLEARKDDKGEHRWHYAPARMSSRECEVTCDGKVVWHLELTRRQGRAETYFNRVFR